MAKINKFILEYGDIFKEKIDYNELKPPKKVMQRFVRYLKSVDDKRLAGMIDYPLEEIIVIAFMAVLGGANSWQGLEVFGRSYQKWLGKFLKLENGIPSHDTFRRVFGLIKPEQLELATVAFIEDIIGKLKKSLDLNSSDIRHICVDGKEARATGRKRDTTEEIRNLQTLHIYDNSNAICLYSAMIDRKTNEIPVAQSILSCMNLKNSIVSFDAMNTQKKTIAIINEQKGDYVGALKGNHKMMESEVCELFSEETLQEIKRIGTEYFQTTEKAHSQVETREFFLSSKIQWFQDLKEWPGLKSFICYRKTMINLITEKKTVESRYYISSVKDVSLCADTIRSHWGIENRLHWHLDSTFFEDDNTTIDKNAFNNLSIINKMTLSMLKLAKPLFPKSSLRMMRLQFGWKMEDCLSQVLGFFSDEEFLESLKSIKS